MRVSFYVSLASAVVMGACATARHPLQPPAQAPTQARVVAPDYVAPLGRSEPSGAAEPSVALPIDSPALPLEPKVKQSPTLHWPPSQLEAPKLSSGLHSPMPGGLLGGYAQDTGLDIAGFEMPVHALADATVVYSEAGHSRWPRGSRYSVLLRLDQPIVWHGRRITHAWYTHLKSVIALHPPDASVPMHVDGGVALGISGHANRSPHLHLGLLLDNRTDQHFGTYLLFDEVREVLGDYRAGQRLP